MPQAAIRACYVDLVRNDPGSYIRLSGYALLYMYNTAVGDPFSITAVAPAVYIAMLYHTGYSPCCLSYTVSTADHGGQQLHGCMTHGSVREGVASTVHSL